MEDQQNQPQDSTNISRGFFKFIYVLFLFAIIIGPLFYLFQNKFIGKNKEGKGKVIATFPLRTVNMQGIGKVSEPIIEADLKMPQGYEKYEFLVDSGAAISSLPYEMAQELNLNPAFLPRLAFRGFGNTTSFAYQADVTLNLGGNDLSIPVVFTEASQSKFLLGRKGFFDSYTIAFNHEQKLIEITK